MVMVSAEVVDEALVSFDQDIKAFGWGKVCKILFGMLSHVMNRMGPMAKFVNNNYIFLNRLAPAVFELYTYNLNDKWICPEMICKGIIAEKQISYTGAVGLECHLPGEMYSPRHQVD